MILALGMSIADARHEWPGVLYDMATLRENAAKKAEGEKKGEDDEWTS